MKTAYSILLAVLMAAPSASYAKGFLLLSSEISGQLSDDQVFSGFGCSGQNISPSLEWKNPPKGTKSFAVTMYDPDAPTGSGWWHWIVFDISSDKTSLQLNAGDLSKKLTPKDSVQSITSFGTKGYGGACPPQGDKPHQYIFTVYALKVDRLGLNADSTPSTVGFYLNNNILAKASLVAYYSR